MVMFNSAIKSSIINMLLVFSYFFMIATFCYIIIQKAKIMSEMSSVSSNNIDIMYHYSLYGNKLLDYGSDTSSNSFSIYFIICNSW